MAVPDSLVLASEVIGFLSFTFTLLTAIGVYADLIKTLRGAPAAIPIALGNLREEIKYEQLLCKRGLGAVDSFHILPGKRLGSKSRREVNRLLENTLKHLWTEFCDIERVFLVEGDRPWNGHATDDSDNADEKEAGNRRRRSGRPRPTHQQSFIRGRMGWIEAGLSRDRRTYYNTDISHRFKWWWKKDDVDNLAQQLQRIQIRRIERDGYEANELVKRALKIYGRRSGDDVYHSSEDSDGDDDGGGGDPDSDDGGGRPRTSGHSHRRRHSGVTSSRTNDHRRSRNSGTHHGGIREVSEKEIIRRRASSPENVSTPRRPPSVVGSRRGAPQRGSVIYEYEIVNPGGIHIEYESPRGDRERSFDRRRSRSVSRGHDSD